jgi:hypothetical protein
MKIIFIISTTHFRSQDFFNLNIFQNIISVLLSSRLHILIPGGRLYPRIGGVRRKLEAAHLSDRPGEIIY